jgi:hypothetical protein
VNASSVLRIDNQDVLEAFRNFHTDGWLQDNLDAKLTGAVSSLGNSRRR